MRRPELVKSWKKPLSSDAFSNFGVDNAEEHEAEVPCPTSTPGLGPESSIIERGRQKTLTE